MILTLNCGSSSIKYALFTNTCKLISSGSSEEVSNHTLELQKIISEITATTQITRIVHRVVHGGELFTKPTLITDTTIPLLESLNDLAPLHNPIQVECIKYCKTHFPSTPNIAVFDTAFFHHLKPENYRYAIPTKYYTDHHIRKYGFHGISHHYLSETYNKKNSTIITCHLGNGASITLTKNGKPITTSMGFTPLDGLIMGTRCGSIDPAIIPHIMQKENLSPKEISKILYKQSGLLALSEDTHDMKTLLEKRKSDPKAQLAITMFVNSIVKEIGAYIALTKGNVDAIIFSGTIGIRSSYLRNQIKSHFKYLPHLQFLTIPTNEELMMAKESRKLK